MPKSTLPSALMVGVVLVWLALPQVLTTSYTIAITAQLGIGLIACTSLYLLVAQGGMLSFGHAMYLGIGAYITAHGILLGMPWLQHSLANAASASTANLLLPLLLPWLPLVAGVLTALMGALLGWLCTRHNGVGFSMTTFGLAELLWAAALALPWVFGGESGLSIDRGVFSPQTYAANDFFIGWDWRSERATAQLIHIYAALCILAIVWLICSPFGLTLSAVRDQSERVRTLGQRPSHTRWLAFVLATFFAGIAGSLQTLQLELVSPETFAVSHSTLLLIFVVLGGTSHVSGAIIGAIGWVFFSTVLSRYTPAWWLYAGLIFMWTLWHEPKGVGAWAHSMALRYSIMQPPKLTLRPLVRLIAYICLISGIIVLTEMAFHRQQVAALGPHLQIGINNIAVLRLDINQPWQWAAATVCAALGALGVWVLRRWQYKQSAIRLQGQKQ